MGPSNPSSPWSGAADGTSYAPAKAVNHVHIQEPYPFHLSPIIVNRATVLSAMQASINDRLVLLFVETPEASGLILLCLMGPLTDAHSRSRILQPPGLLHRPNTPVALTKTTEHIQERRCSTVRAQNIFSTYRICVTRFDYHF